LPREKTMRREEKVLLLWEEISDKGSNLSRTPPKPLVFEGEEKKASGGKERACILRSREQTSGASAKPGNGSRLGAS